MTIIDAFVGSRDAASLIQIRFFQPQITLPSINVNWRLICGGKNRPRVVRNHFATLDERVAKLKWHIFALSNLPCWIELALLCDWLKTALSNNFYFLQVE